MFATRQNPNTLVDGEFNGLEGVIDEVIHQGIEWRVRIRGRSIWTAHSRVPCILVPGNPVRVIDRDKLKLTIEPM